MNTKTFSNIVKFIGKKNPKYGLDKSDVVLKLLSIVEDGDKDSQEVLDFFYWIINDVKINSEILRVVMNLAGDVGGYDERYEYFKDLKNMGKIDFELTSNDISNISGDNLDTIKKLIEELKIPVNGKFLGVLDPFQSTSTRIEILKYLKSKDPNILSSLNNHFDFINMFYYPNSQYAHEDREMVDFLLKDKNFISVLNRRKTSNFDPYLIISKMLSVTSNMNDVLIKLGDIGKKFHNEMRSGNHELNSGYYERIFNNINFLYAAKLFGDDAVTFYFKELFDSGAFGPRGKRYIIKNLSNISNKTKEYILGLDEFWNYIKSNNPNDYQKFYDQLKN